MKIGLKFRCHSTRQGICPIRELNDDNILNVESRTSVGCDYGDNNDTYNGTIPNQVDSDTITINSNDSNPSTIPNDGENIVTSSSIFGMMKNKKVKNKEVKYMHHYENKYDDGYVDINSDTKLEWTLN